MFQDAAEPPQPSRRAPLLTNSSCQRMQLRAPPFGDNHRGDPGGCCTHSVRRPHRAAIGPLKGPAKEAHERWELEVRTKKAGETSRLEGNSPDSFTRRVRRRRRRRGGRTDNSPFCKKNTPSLCLFFLSPPPEGPKGSAGLGSMAGMGCLRGAPQSDAQAWSCSELWWRWWSCRCCSSLSALPLLCELPGVHGR